MSLVNIMESRAKGAWIMLKNRFALGLCLLAVLALTGCRGYTDASVSPPKSWGTYEAGSLSFSFEAGWQAASNAE